MPVVYTNGIALYYERQGSGHPLLLIPAAGFGGWLWKKAAPTLSARYQVILPDMRGTGRSDKPDGPYPIEMLGRDLTGLLDEMHVRGAFVAGHSLGAQLALWLAGNRPELVSKLVLLAPSFNQRLVAPGSLEAWEDDDPPEDELSEVVERDISELTAPGFAEAHPEVVQELLNYRLSGAVPPEAYQAQVEALQAAGSAHESLLASLEAIQVPTLVLYGEQDRIASPEDVTALAGRIQAGRAVVRGIPGAGHLFPIEAPAATAETIMGFLNANRYAPQK